MVALMGAVGEHPPTDEDGFAAFTRSRCYPIIADALATAEAVTSIRSARRARSLAQPGVLDLRARQRTLFARSR